MLSIARRGEKLPVMAEIEWQSQPKRQAPMTNYSIASSISTGTNQPTAIAIAIASPAGDSATDSVLQSVSSCMSADM